jgi:predicted DNA-binding transcriptional regulator AlpA
VTTTYGTFCVETKIMDRFSQETSAVAGEMMAAALPLLIGKREVARLTGISVRSIDRLVSVGRFVPPVMLGGRVLWNRQALTHWVAGGCPDCGGKERRS